MQEDSENLEKIKQKLAEIENSIISQSCDYMNGTLTPDDYKKSSEKISELLENVSKGIEKSTKGFIGDYKPTPQDVRNMVDAYAISYNELTGKNVLVIGKLNGDKMDINLFETA